MLLPDPMSQSRTFLDLRCEPLCHARHVTCALAKNVRGTIQRRAVSVHRTSNNRIAEQASPSADTPNKKPVRCISHRFARIFSYGNLTVIQRMRFRPRVLPESARPGVRFQATAEYLILFAANRRAVENAVVRGWHRPG